VTPGPEPSASEMAAFHAHNVERMLAHLRHGVVAAVVVTLVMAPGAWLVYPGHRWEAAIPCVAGAVWMALGSLLARTAFARRHALALTASIAWGVGLVSSVAAWNTGGYASPFFYIVFIGWIFVTAYLPVSPRQLHVICLPIPVLFGLSLALHGVAGWPPPLVAVVLLGCHAYAAFGVAGRHRDAIAAFVAQQRLAEARQELERLNGELEGRVESQVGQIRAHAAKVDRLNKELRAEVRERSRELARTLGRLDVVPIRPGTVLGGRVEVEGTLADGGMGSVYRGKDRATGEKVAVKVMREGAGNPELVRRFLSEAEAAASIDHPAIVETRHVDVDEEGRPFIVMELVEGVPLRSLIDEARLDAVDVPAIGARVADALVHAHAAGVVHRDVKPGNILLQRHAPHVRLVDFGIAKRFGAGDLLATHPEQMIGTPAYMAPEQIEGGEITPAADVYALGVVLYEIACGRRPFSGRGPALRLQKVMADPRPIDPEAGLEPELAALIMRCLRPEPADRPEARELAAALAAHEVGQPLEPSRWAARPTMAPPSRTRMRSADRR